MRPGLRGSTRWRLVALVGLATLALVVGEALLYGFEFDADLGFEIDGNGDDDLVEQLGLAIRTLRRVGQEHVGDLAKKLAPLLAGAFLREVEQKRKIVGGRHHARSPLGK